jgi:hypothetical protein
MTAKSALRLLIACVIVWIALSFALPKVGIARSRMLPPPMAYSGSASKKTTGYISAKHTEPSSNIFKSTETVYLVDYQFRAPGVPGFGGAKPKEASPWYKGTVNVTQEFYAAAKVGSPVPVKYDPTDPELSGIDLAGAGRNGSGHGSMLSLWIAITLVTLVLGYLLAPWLERIILRENF